MNHLTLDQVVLIALCPIYDLSSRFVHIPLHDIHPAHKNHARVVVRTVSNKNAFLFRTSVLVLTCRGTKQWGSTTPELNVETTSTSRYPTASNFLDLSLIRHCYTESPVRSALKSTIDYRHHLQTGSRARQTTRQSEISHVGSNTRYSRPQGLVVVRL